MTPPVLLLLGGLGTRLRSITRDEMPKPMVPVNYEGKTYPFLQFLLHYLYEQGVRSLVFCVGHLADHIESYFGDGSEFGLQIRYDDRGSELTASRIKHAMTTFGFSEALVHCGDVFHPLALDSFTSHFDKNPDNLVQVAVLNTNAQEHYRPNMIINENNQITGYRADDYENQHAVIETGVLMVRDGLLEKINAAENMDLATEIYPALIEQNSLGGYVADAVFFDIGTPEDYYRFCSYVEKGRAKPLMRKTH